MSGWYPHLTSRQLIDLEDGDGLHMGIAWWATTEEETPYVMAVRPAPDFRPEVDERGVVTMAGRGEDDPPSLLERVDYLLVRRRGEHHPIVSWLPWQVPLEAVERSVSWREGHVLVVAPPHMQEQGRSMALRQAADWLDAEGMTWYVEDGALVVTRG